MDITESLEYKILKYLQENDNGEFIDVSSLNENTKTLQLKIKDLKSNKLLESRKILTNGLNCVGRLDCRIVLKGKEYINNINNKKIIDNKNDFRGATIGQLNQSDDLRVLKTEIKQTIQHKAKEKQQNAIVSFIEKFWWQILIPLLIGVILFAIQQKWFT